MLSGLRVRWGVPPLVVGVALGAGFATWPWIGPVHATPEARRAAPAASDAPGGPSLADVSRDLARIAATATPSVVHIESKLESPTRGMVEETGSGVIVTSTKAPGYYVVTNRHVIGDAEDLNQVAIRLRDGRVFRPERKWTDRETDLAVLKLSAETAPAATWGNSDRLEIGNLVLAVGSPFGLSQSVTLGIVSARGRALHLGKRSDLVNQDFIQTDAAINFGNSGGPLIDVNGQVVGINTAIASNSGGNDGIGFSIPSNLVRRVVEELLDRGQVRRAYLGVMLDPDFTAEKAKDLKLDRRRGTRVVRVYPNSPASRADLQTDDVVLTFNGIDVVDENHLINLVSLTEIGRKVTLGVLRGGKRMQVEVNLSDRHELDDRSESSRQPGMGEHVESLGLTLHAVTPALAGQLGFNEAHGLLVLRVDPSSPVAGSVDVYDVLEEVARTRVASISDVERALKTERAPNEVLLRFRRGTGPSQHSHVVVWQR